MQNTEKTKYPLWSLVRFLKPYTSRAVMSLVTLLLAAAALLALPISVGNVIDTGFKHKIDLDQLTNFTIVSFLVAVFSAWRFYLMSTLGEYVVADIRKQLFKRVLSLDAYQYETIKVGEILSRLTTDTALIEQTVGTSISLFLRNSIQLIGGCAMLFYTSWRLTTVIVIITPLALTPLLGILRYSRQLARVSQDKLAQTNAYAGEVLFAAQVAQAFNHEKKHQQYYADTITEALVAAKKRIRMRTIFSFVLSFSVCIAVMFVFWAGSQLVITDPPIITHGELVRYMAYTIFVTTAMASISEVYGDIQRASGASERILELMAAKPEIESPENPVALPQNPQGAIELKEVTFAYPSRTDKCVLDNMSLSINPGEMVALVGPSGAGKSTLLQLLLRFYQAQEGCISIDGNDISHYSLEDLRSLIAIVPQEVIVFSGTIYENILYGRPEASEAEVLAAAKMALVDPFVAQLPDGYQTAVGERGLRLSGGQRQRLAIARAFLRNSPILLLDEATSALDAESERLVQQALDTLIKDRTTLVIAHRLATIKQADTIVFIEDGCIKAKGKHQELLAKSKAYAHLANLQFIQ